MTTEEQLCEELKTYCETHSLPHVSADELLVNLMQQRDDLQEHINWADDFVERWDAYANRPTEEQLAMAFSRHLHEAIDKFLQYLPAGARVVLYWH
jgi:hypothetical protein